MKKKNNGDNVVNLTKVKNNLPVKQDTIDPVNEKCKIIVRSHLIPLFEDKELDA